MDEEERDGAAENILNTIFENSELMQGAMELFTAFTALQQAGFSEDQSLFLVGEVLKKSGGAS